jgi:DNA-binding XRE family transcriptional regulator
MTNLPQNEQMRIAINDYCNAKSLSKNELATQIGVSSATLSKIENGKWNDIDEKLWRKIWNKVSDITTPALFKTFDFAICSKACEAAQKNHFMIGLIADTGMGKTTALTAYSLRKNVFYMSYDKTMAPKHFFASLLREMGIPFLGNINEMVNKIADELNTLANPLLIIDECGKLSHTMILYLHVLRDKTIKNCGIVLGGMPYFKNNLIKFSNRQKEGMAEFNRRINLWQELKGLSKNEIAYICQSHNIVDNEVLRELQNKKRFGDLYNEILLIQIQNEAA